IDNALDCAPAHRTETNVVPGEHDAVDLRPVVALCLVVRALEGAYLSRVLLGGKHLRLVLLLFLEQRIHVPLWPALAPDLPASFLDCARVLFKRFLFPGGRNRRAGAHQILPLQLMRVQQSGYIWLPGLNSLRRRGIRDRRSVVFVGQARDVMSEFVDKDVGRPQTIRRNGAVQTKYPAAPVRLAIHENLHEIIGRVGCVVPEGTVIEREDVALRAKSIISGAEWRSSMDSRRRTRDPGFRRLWAQGPHVEVALALLERRGRKEKCGQPPGVFFKLAALAGGVPIADDKEIDFRFGTPLLLNLYQRSRRRRT